MDSIRYQTGLRFVLFRQLPSSDNPAVLAWESNQITRLIKCCVSSSNM